MESKLELESKLEIEGCICYETPLEVYETTCCATVICKECAQQCDKGPHRGGIAREFKLVKNEFLQNVLSDLKRACKFGGIEFDRDLVLEHQETGDKNRLKAVVENTLLH